jgi:hypothetical protein
MKKSKTCVPGGQVPLRTLNAHHVCAGHRLGALCVSGRDTPRDTAGASQVRRPPSPRRTGAPARPTPRATTRPTSATAAQRQPEGTWDLVAIADLPHETDTPSMAWAIQRSRSATPARSSTQPSIPNTLTGSAATRHRRKPMGNNRGSVIPPRSRDEPFGLAPGRAARRRLPRPVTGYGRSITSAHHRQRRRSGSSRLAQLSMAATAANGVS